MPKTSEMWINSYVSLFTIWTTGPYLRLPDLPPVTILLFKMGYRSVVGISLAVYGLSTFINKTMKFLSYIKTSLNFNEINQLRSPSVPK